MAPPSRTIHFVQSSEGRYVAHSPISDERPEPGRQLTVSQTYTLIRSTSSRLISSRRRS